MPLNFPLNPSSGEIYSFGDMAWSYNGYAWRNLGNHVSGAFYYQQNPPTGITFGTRWMDSDTGVEYIYINDGNSSQWVQPTNDGSSTVIQATNIVIGATYAATRSDYYIGVSYSGTAGIVLPSNPETGRMIVVKDESGYAGDPYKYIVITGATASNTIDRQPSATININNASLQFIYRNGWRII
jgi:hypothetical protein